MGLERAAWLEARQTIRSLLSADNSLLRDDQELRKKAFVKQEDSIMHLPAQIGNLFLSLDIFLQAITPTFTHQFTMPQMWA